MGITNLKPPYVPDEKLGPVASKTRPLGPCQGYLPIVKGNNRFNVQSLQRTIGWGKEREPEGTKTCPIGLECDVLKQIQ